MTKKEAKIRGHQMALANARHRGDRAGVSKQLDALRALGAQGRKANPGGAPRKHHGKANPSRRGGRRVSGYRRNPEGDDPLFDAAEKMARAEEAAEAAKAKVADQKEKVADAKAEEKQAEKDAKGGSAADKKAAKAAERKRKREEKKLADAKAKKEAADAKAAKAAERKKKREAGGSAPKKPRKAQPKAEGKTMAAKKRSKKSYQEAAKKGAATKKRNARKAAGGKSAAKKPAAKAKASGARKRSRSHYPKVPKGYRRLKSRVSVQAKHRRTGKRRTFKKVAAYKSNPMGDLGKFAVLGGGVLVGAILADMLRRYVDTMAPKGGKEPFYGNLASERIDSYHPSNMAYLAQAGLGAAGMGLGFLARKKSPAVSTFLWGLGLGAFVNVGLELFSYVVAPALMKSDNINDKNIGNRLYPLQQKHSQDYVKSIIDAENKGIEAGGKYKPDGTAAGLPGRGAVAGLPQGQGQQHRQLPPANATGYRPQPQGARGGQVAGLPAQAGQVGCPGGGCGGGGCTGGRNCSCPKCTGNAPAADLRGTPARPGNVNGPRQLGQGNLTPVAFMPRASGARVAMGR
jgi:hypothetical protein